MRDAGLPFAVMADAKRYHVTTFGCQMNVHDSERLSGSLEAAGYIRSDGTPADVVVINTCSVRQHAEDRAYSKLGRVRDLKKTKPDSMAR